MKLHASVGLGAPLAVLAFLTARLARGQVSAGAERERRVLPEEAVSGGGHDA